MAINDDVKPIKQVQVNSINHDIEANYYTSTTTPGTTSIDTTIEAIKARIDNLEARGRYLSSWNCTTGKPDTDPESLPYAYKTGDYYVVSTVGATNYKPSGTSYTGAASTTAAESNVAVGDYYAYDTTAWTLIHIPYAANNQTVKVGSSIFDASAAVNIVAGNNVTVTANTTSGAESITINATDTTYSPATTSADGLMSSTDKTKLDAIVEAGTVGAATKGIYLNSGVPTAMTYELNKTVPSDAVFTDHITSATTSGSGNVVSAVTANASGNLTVTKTSLAQTDASVSGTKAIFSTNTDVQGTTIPATTTADLVLKSTSTAGTVVWGTAGGGGTTLYKHSLVVHSTIDSFDIPIVVLSKRSTSYTQPSELIADTLIFISGSHPIVGILNDAKFANITADHNMLYSYYHADDAKLTRSSDSITVTSDTVTEL